MRKFKSVVSVVVLIALVVSIPSLGYAKVEKDKSNNGKNDVKVEEVKEEKNNNSSNKDKPGKGQDKSWKETKDLLQSEKDALESEKDDLESQKDELEKQLKEAEENENKELEEQLKAQIEEVEKQRLKIKSEMKDVINLIKEVIKNRYSVDELEEFIKIRDELEAENENIMVIPVENINAKNKDIKFDMPPVIKEGRTLIPVRALTQGFGAEVKWDPEEKKVTVIKGEKKIVLYLDSKIALVNGKEIELDVPSKAYNNRTYVPLRFIVENFELNIDYDEDTGLIEIDDEE